MTLTTHIMGNILELVNKQFMGWSKQLLCTDSKGLGINDICD